MKTQTDQTREQQNAAVPKVQQEQSTGGTATITDNRPSTVYQRKLRETMNAHVASKALPIQRKANNTGLPDNLKSGIENLSGYAMDDVKVHYNSSKPAQLQAHAYAQGTDIHIASGQEKHLPHEAWHVVQQKQGRVKPTMQLKGKVNVNDDTGLEKEADVMGAKALQTQTTSLPSSQPFTSAIQTLPVIQRLVSVGGWKKSTFGMGRPRILKSIDVAIGQYHKVSGGDREEKISALRKIGEKIVLFRKSKSGKRNKRDTAVNRLYLEVIGELSTLGVHDQLEYLEPLSSEDELRLEAELEELPSEEKSTGKEDSTVEDDLSEQLGSEADMELGDEFNYTDHPGAKALEEVGKAVRKCASLIGGSTKVLEAKTAACAMIINQNIRYLEQFISFAKKSIPLLREYRDKTAPELAELLDNFEEVNSILNEPLENYDEKELLKEYDQLGEDSGIKTEPSKEDIELAELQSESDKEPEGSPVPELENPDELEEKMEEAKEYLSVLKKVKKSFTSLAGEEQNLRNAYHKSFEEYFKKVSEGESIDHDELQEIIDNKSETIDTIKDKMILNINDLALDLGEDDIDIEHDTFARLVDLAIENAAKEVFGKHLVAIHVEDQGISMLTIGETKEGSQIVTGRFNFNQGVNAFLGLLQRALGLTTVYNVTSANLGIRISLGVTMDALAKLLELGGSIFVALKGSINVQDDRRLRAGGSLTLGATAKASVLWKFLQAKATISKEIGIGGTFDDLKHFVAWIMQKLHEMKMGLRSALLEEKGGSLTDEEQAELRSEEHDGIDWAALKSKKPVKVTSDTNTKKIGASAALGILDGSVSETEKKTTFHKENESNVKVVKKGTTTAKSTSVSLKIIPGTGKFSGEYTETEVRNDSNPDNDGKYRNFKIGLPSLNFSELTLASFREKASDIENLYSEEERPIDKAKTIFNDLKNKYDGAKTAPKQAGLSESLDKINVTLEWNWIETQGKYQRQYFRLNKSQSHAHSLPIGEVPIFSTGVVGVSGEAGAEISGDRSWGLYEKITANTLTYLHTVYNGLVRRQGGERDWKQYRDAHKSEIIRLIKKVGDEGSTPHKEAVASEIQEGVLKQCKNFKLDPYEVDEETIIDSFETYLKKVEEATKTKAGEGWQPK